MDQENKQTVLHEPTEIALLKLDIAKEFVLLVYRNFAALWWWNGLDIKAKVDQDPAQPNRYYVKQTEESKEYDPLKFPLKPQNLGFLEITPVDKDTPKPIEIRIVCIWPVVQSFWKELEVILRREFTVIDTLNTNVAETEDNKQSDEISVPKRFSDLNRWKELYKVIRGWTDMSYNEISEKIEKDARYRKLPHSPDTIAKAMKAGKMGKLND